MPRGFSTHPMADIAALDDMIHSTVLCILAVIREGGVALSTEDAVGMATGVGGKLAWSRETFVTARCLAGIATGEDMR